MKAVLFLLLAVGAAAPAPKFKPATVTVHATEFAFSAPKSVAAGTMNFHLVNDGKQLHHVSIVKLLHGKTTADYVAALKKPGPPPAWSVEVGGPNAAVPGGMSDAIVTLEPGNYALVCYVPSPGDPTPHLMKGMIAPLTVTPSSAPVMEPTPELTIRLSDYKFGFSKPLTAGHHWVRVVNDAKQPHEVLFVKLPPGQTAAGVAKWVEDGQKGAPPAMPMGGASPLASGRSMTLNLDFTPGTYGMICFLPDAKDGKPHAMHGMTAQFEVK